MRRRLVLVLLTLVLLPLIAARCPGGASGGEQAAKWVPNAERAVSAARIPSVYKRLQLGDDAARARARSLVDDAPEVRPNTNEATVLTRITTLRDFYVSVDAAAAAIMRRWQDADAVVEGLVDGSVLPGAQPSTKFRDYLIRKTKAVLKDVTCDLAWKFMTVTEANTINAELYDKGYTRTATNEVNGVAKMTEKAAVEAIRNAVIIDAAKFFIPGRVIAWGSYAFGLYGKAKGMVEDGNTNIPHPNGAVTRAFVYYVRLCVQPPGS